MLLLLDCIELLNIHRGWYPNTTTLVRVALYCDRILPLLVIRIIIP